MAVSVTESRRCRLPAGALPAALLFLWVAAAGVCGKVQKQVVMFHQYPVRVDVDLEARTAVVSPPENIPGLGKSRTFYDYNTRVIAYKDYRTKHCHLERMSEEEKLPGAEEDSVEQSEEAPEGSDEREAERRLHRQLGLLGPTQHNRNRQKRAPKPIPVMRRRPKMMYMTETVLTKYEVLRLAGRRISHFCRGFPASLLVQRPPSPVPKLQSTSRIPWLSANELPGDGQTDSEEHRLLLEAALVKARLAELELQTLDSSDEEIPEGRGKTNKASRSKRQASSSGGNGWQWPRKYKGQTQSQFVSFGGEGKGEGSAQAESRPEGSTTLVRGVNGMGQSQSQSSVGDGCEGCYPGGGGYSPGSYPGGAQYGPWQAGGRGAPGLIAGQTRVDGAGAGRGPGVGTTGTRGYGPGTPGQLRPAPGTPGAPGYDAQGQYLRPGQLAQRPVGVGAGTPGYGGVPGVAPGRGVDGGRGYGTNGLGPAAVSTGYGGPGVVDGDAGYRRPSTVPGGQPSSPGYLGPTGAGTGYGTQPGGAIRGPGYRGPVGVNGQVGPTGVGAVSRPLNGGIYPGRPSYIGPSASSQPGYGGQATNGAGRILHRPTGPSGHISPGDGRRGHGGMIQPGSHIGYPSTGGQQVTGGTPSAHGGQHLRPGMIQRPTGRTQDYGAPGYGVEDDGRVGGRIPGGVPGSQVPLAHGGQPMSPGRVPSGHGVSEHSLYGPGAGRGTQTVNGYGTYHGGGGVPGRGIHDGRGHHVPSGPGGQVGVPGGHGVLPGGHGVLPGGHAGIPGGYVGAPGGHVGSPGGHVGIPGGYIGAPGGHIGAPGGYVAGPGGHLGPGRHAGVPGGHLGAGGHVGVPGGHVGAPVGHIGPTGGHVGGHVRPGIDGMGGGYPGAVHQGSHVGPHGGVGGHPDYGRYPTGSAGHGLTGPGGDGRFRGTGSVTPEATIPDHLAPESIRRPGVVNGRYPGIGGALQPGQVSPGIGGTTGLGIGRQRPDGTLIGTGQYGRPGGPGYPGGQRPGYGVDGDSQYGRPGYYDGQAYPLARPGVGGRGQAGVADAGESQAQTSVTQDDKEIKAGASSQGRLGDGKAQAQVSGSYSGTGAFSAQAQTSDAGRGAQSQVTGNKDGGSSSAQGNGGSGQSQAQVQLSSSNGATKAEAQSGGWQHGSNTQVQAGENGGMADAQSSGPGTTSSQAQVGFKPYRANGSVQRTPFRGGGTASAQSSSFSGQSQSQVQGAYRYGVSFTGAAQAGSGARGSRGTDSASTNGTQRFERDDHAALMPESIKLTPLKNFGDTPSSSQTGTQEGIRSPESLIGQMNGNNGIRHQGGMGHSSRHSSHHQTPLRTHQIGHGSNGHRSSGHGSDGHGSGGHRSGDHGSNGHGSNGHGSNGHGSNGHGSGGHGSNGHGQFDGNSHGMRGSHMNSQIGHQTPNGHAQFNGKTHGMQVPSLESPSFGHQARHGSHSPMAGQNDKVPSQSLDTNTRDNLSGQRIPDQQVSGRRQPENEYPNFGGNGGGKSKPHHGGAQEGDYARETSHSDGKPSVFKTESPRQSQAVFISPMANEDVHISQASDGGGIPAQSVFQPGQVVPGSSGFVIPEGFRGRVIGDSRSIAGDETLAIASPNNGDSQSQTVVLTPGSGKVNYTRIVRPPHGQPVVPAYDDYGQNQGMEDESESPTLRSGLNTRSYMGSEVYSRGDQHVYRRKKVHTRSGAEKIPPSSQKADDEYDEDDDDDDDDEETEEEEVVQPSSPSPLPNSYISVTKSVSGQLNPIGAAQGGNGKQFVNGNYGGNRGTDGGKFAHTYYTKSSTCGYFTFSCNVVFGSNGRAKICKPRPPTNPDGSPCCC